jgi:hypothetical protein
MRWTSEQLADYMTKANSTHTWVVPEWAMPEADPGPESVLQGKIEKWCKGCGYPFLSFHQTKHARHVLPAGWPDMEIIMPKGKTLRIELKSSTGRLSDEQKATRLQFMALGHTIYRITSFKGFLSIVGQI